MLLILLLLKQDNDVISKNVESYGQHDHSIIRVSNDRWLSKGGCNENSINEKTDFYDAYGGIII